MDNLKSLKADDSARMAAYSKLARKVDKGSMSPEVMSRYNLEKNDEKKKFIFLSEFMTDPSFATMTVQEHHFKNDENASHDNTRRKDRCPSGRLLQALT